MKHSILIIGGGVMQVPVITTARSMGLHTIVTDLSAEAPGMKQADYPVVMSTRDVEGSVRVARQLAQAHAIQGVLTVGTDASMTVAAVAGALHLPGIPFEHAENATNKLKMRQCFKKHHIPSPRFMACWKLEDLHKAFHTLTKPLVIKPTMNMGARGVRKLLKESELEHAFHVAKTNSPNGEIIVEEYIEGDELSIDALIYKNKIHIAGIADRIIGHAPYFVERGHILPSNQKPELLQQAIEVMKKGIRALGITHGAAKGDIKIGTSGAYIVELAARLSGGYMSAYTYPYATGVDLIQNAILIAMGLPPEELLPKYNRVAGEHAIIPEPGRVDTIEGIQEAQSIPGVQQVILNIHKDSSIVPITNNVEKAGHVLAYAETRDKLFSIFEQALTTIQIKTKTTLSFQDIKNNAIRNFNKRCIVCSICDGRGCRGQVPGMGGIGTSTTFLNNVKALERYQITPQYIHKVKTPALNTTLFGIELKFPVILSPITGTHSNMGGTYTELEFARAMTQGAVRAGTIAMVGDGAGAEKYLDGLQAISEVQGRGIAIFKPRLKHEDILTRIRKAEDSGALAVGTDIDAGTFLTMKAKQQAVEPKSFEQLEKLVSSTKLPFILKGVMTVADTKLAVDMGAAAVMVSNHGGRVLDHMPGTFEVLPEIVAEARGKVLVLIDGGFRTGQDVFKALACGAQCVGVGRPAAIGAYGGGVYGVEYVLEQYFNELFQTMLLTGSSEVSKCNADSLRKHTR